MKTIKKVSIILTLIFFVSLIITILTGPVQLFSGFESADIHQFKEMSVHGINSLDVQLSDSNVNLYPVNGTNFEFNLSGDYAKNNYSENVNLSVEKAGDILKVRVIYPNNRIILINKNFNLNIGVPENYSGQIFLTTASGNINVEKINIKSFEIKTASGNLNIKNLTSGKEFKVESVSGDIDLENIKSENIEVKSISGEIKSRNLFDNTANFRSVSGNLEINNCTNINSLKTTSGEIKITDYFAENNTNIETSSGNVHLELLEESSVNIEFKSVSGDLKNNFENIKDGKNKIFVKTVSGNLDIIKKIL